MRNKGLCLVLLLAAFSVLYSTSLAHAVTLTVTNPTTGVTWYKGTEYRIKWNWSNYTGNIRIDVYLNNGSTPYATVAAAEPVTHGTNGVTFNVPVGSPWPNSSQYEIRISTTDGQAPDTSGYFTITDPILPSPTLVSPQNGAMVYAASFPAQVQLQWQAVSGASGYELSVDGNQILINSGSQTTYNATLNSGAHTWQARTKNSSGTYGSWSSSFTFTLQQDTLPAPTLVSPQNGATVYAASFPAQVQLQWQAVSGAAGYELSVDGIQVLINSGSQTTYNATLNSGAHTWQARTKNSSGTYGSWSSSFTFSLQQDTLPAPTLVSPQNGATVNAASFPAQVQLQWQAASGAAGYELSVDGNQILINSGSQTTYNATLNSGAHTWQARTKNSSGTYGSWSSSFTFSLQQDTLPAPTLVSPQNGATVNAASFPAQVQLQWQAVSGAAGYELSVDGIQVLINSGSQTTYDATLNSGAHTWKARTKNTSGAYGSWSSEFTFTLQQGIAPPALMSPTNGATLYAPSFPAQVQLQWQAVSGAAGYELSVDGNQVLINSGSQTTYDATLNSGAHTWKARTKNSSGAYGSWSSEFTFTLQQGIAPPALMSPTNGATVYAPSFPAQVQLQWQAVSRSRGI